jgi:outer membrane receptor protein involved in Fe transport
MRHQWAGAAVAALIAMGAPCAAAEGTGQQRNYNIPEQDLASALKAFAATSHRQMVAPSAPLAGKRSGSAIGLISDEQALGHILAGTGLSFRIVEGTFVVRPIRDVDDGEAAWANTADIIVTGTRIRGAPVASPVISVGQEQIRNAGQGSLGEVVRSIPQSFGGGQNPGLGTNVPASSGVDIGGGSSIDLRGLGSDATLTLLNGHRLSYSASRQSVDISAIPLAAVDRVEIIADGASALYGSDAVAGVANVILRRPFDGLKTSARLAGSTDGGNFQQLYGALGGATWSGGGLVAAYEYGSNSAIRAEQRSYAATRSPGLTLYPALSHHSASLNGSQQLLDGLSFEIDALYNHRTTNSVFPLNFAGDLRLSSGRFFGTAESYEVTPVLRLALGGDWRTALTASYGRDRVDFAADLFFSGVKVPGGAGFYRNQARSIELAGDGSLFQLPSGPAKLAVGAGYRRIDFRVFKGADSSDNADQSQDSYYGYAELSLPLVGPEQQIPFAYRLNASAAIRYEDYPGVGDIVTPKLGLIYAPSEDLDLKASWGRSFRAPTLLQQFTPPAVTLIPAASAGGAGLPDGATVLLVQGGNPNLKPERATTWSATLDLHPRVIPGAKLEISYFSTRYRDRIVTPIAATAAALSNPIYRDLVTRNPSAALQQQVIAASGTFVNAADGPYVPADVVAIVDNSNLNAGRQRLKGVDVLASYETRLAGDQLLNLGFNAAWLKSDQQLSGAQPIVPLAGTIFNPPHWRLRGNVSWTSGPATLSAFVNYTGPARDTRFSPVVRLGSVTTADVTLRVRTPEDAGLLGGLDLAVSVLNAFNAKPTPIRTTLFTDTPYDSTNYSPAGRVISVGVAKAW